VVQIAFPTLKTVRAGFEAESSATGRARPAGFGGAPANAGAGEKKSPPSRLLFVIFNF